MKYDLIVIGAGPAGIMTALETMKLDSSAKVLVLEKGNSIEKRICPKRKLGRCVECSPCNITTGFAGAGAYSDGKLSLSPDVGGILPEFIGYDETKKLIEYVDKLYVDFGTDKQIFGLENSEEIDKIRKKAILSSLKLIDCPIRHMGTEVGYEIYGKIQKALIESGAEIKFRNKVEDLIIEDNKVVGVVADTSYYADKVIASVGRDGSEWFENMCRKYGIETSAGTVDIGVRVETRNEVMKKINDTLYEAKLVYYTPTFDDKVRTFCSNPGGVVATEYYDDNLAVVNGHSYKSDSMKTDNTNFALLVSKTFTEPFKSPIEYGKYIAKLCNMLSGNKIIVQRYGDFKRGRRTTTSRLYRNNIMPTLIDAVPGDLSLVLPYRIMKDIDEMIQALDKVTPGIASDETLLYGVEVKFYSNRVKLTNDFQTTVENLYALGDGAGVTRGLMQANCNGVWLARHLHNVKE
jgi:uncharacterized protein